MRHVIIYDWKSQRTYFHPFEPLSHFTSQNISPQPPSPNKGKHLSWRYSLDVFVDLCHQTTSPQLNSFICAPLIWLRLHLMRRWGDWRSPPLVTVMTWLEKNRNNYTTKRWHPSENLTAPKVPIVQTKVLTSTNAIYRDTLDGGSLCSNKEQCLQKGLRHSEHLTRHNLCQHRPHVSCWVRALQQQSPTKND